jgi:uncharacterized protein
VAGDTAHADELADLYAKQTRVEHPMAPAGTPPLLSREEVRRHFGGGTDEPIADYRTEGIVIHETADPEVIVAEFRYVGTVSGQTFGVPCVFVLRVVDGEIVESRDYISSAERARVFRELAGPRRTIERFLLAATSESPGDMADCYGEDVTIEVPFGAGLVPERIETTREQLRARFMAGAALRRYTTLSDVRIHETADPDVWLVEYRLGGSMVEDGSSFSVAFALVLRFLDGLIVHSRDYTDMIAGARVLGRLPELRAMLDEGRVAANHDS